MIRTSCPVSKLLNLSRLFVYFSPNQDELFLPDMIANPEENVLRLSLYEHQTLVIPTGWIHAVYTPSDSVVLGGNFLHGLDIDLQGKASVSLLL